MKKLTLVIALTLLSSKVFSQDNVNKFFFANGIEFNRWNKYIGNSGYLYVNTLNETNEVLYNEAVKVIQKYGMDFDFPTEHDETNTIDEFEINEMIYLRNHFLSLRHIDNIYENDKVKIVVSINDHRSRILVYIKKAK